MEQGKCLVGELASNFHRPELLSRIVNVLEVDIPHLCGGSVSEASKYYRSTLHTNSTLGEAIRTLNRQS